MAENDRIIWDYFKAKGFTDCGIAGLMGNLYAESGLIPNNLQNSYEKKLGMTDRQYTMAVDNETYKNFATDSAGYGLAQWTYKTRKANLLDFCQQRNKSIGDLLAQLDFLYLELTTSFPSVVQVLRTTCSVLIASNKVLLDFERPANQSEERQYRRADYGQKFYNMFHQEKEVTGTMKYSVNNLPLVCMMTNSTCYKGTRKFQPKGVLWHSTGANNTYLKRYVQPSEGDPNYDQLIQLLGKNKNGNDWNHIERQAGLNCWIGRLADSTITTVQTMPWDFRPWGCGAGPKGSCNNGWIQFEICEDDLNNAEYFQAVYKEACEITAYLCKLYNIDPLGTVNLNGVIVPTITCHNDAYKLGVGGGHSDINHWFPKYGKNMETARQDVAALIAGTGDMEEEEDMTQEVFNQYMNQYMADLAKKPVSGWAQADLLWAQQNGLIVGDDTGNLMPRSLLTREAFAAVLHRFYDKMVK